MKSYILYASLAINLFAFLELNCFTDMISECSVAPPDSMITSPCYCDNERRFTEETDGGGKMVAQTEAQTKLNRFHEQYPACTMSGAFISKRALDALFCSNDTWNGIYCYMGINDDDTYTMIFEGNHYNGSKIKRADDVEMQFFTAETLCPDWCGAIAPE